MYIYTARWLRIQLLSYTAFWCNCPDVHLVDEEFLLSISDDRGGWDECSLWEKVVVVFLKRQELGCVENGKGMRRVGEVERDCGMLFVSSSDPVGAV